MPRPQKHVFICTQSRPADHPRGSCGGKGAMAVYDEFLRQWQAKGLFATVAVTNSGCFGPCPLGPSVLVYPEGVLYAQVTPADVAEIIDKHLINGEVVTRLQAPTMVW